MRILWSLLKRVPRGTWVGGSICIGWACQEAGAGLGRALKGADRRCGALLLRRRTGQQRLPPPLQRRRRLLTLPRLGARKPLRTGHAAV